MHSALFANLTIIAAAIAGFYSAHYIRSHKKSGAKMVCPLDSDCEVVVHSDYSKLIGIPLEYLGMVYYALVFSSYLVQTLAPGTLPILFVQFILGVTVVAFAFSIYLTGVQLFKLKEWCTWCLVSASMCLIIFIAAFLIT